MTAAGATLDHAVKAIRLRFADGFRDAISKQMPSVMQRSMIIAGAGSSFTVSSDGSTPAHRSSPRTKHDFQRPYSMHGELLFTRLR